MLAGFRSSNPMWAKAGFMKSVSASSISGTWCAGVVDGKRKSLGSVFVSSGYSALHRRFRFRFLFLRVLLGPLKYFTKYTAKVNKLRTYLTFFLLGYPELAKHCDFVGRFCWDKDTTEDNFNSYLTKMDRLSGGQLKLEIQIKEWK